MPISDRVAVPATTCSGQQYPLSVFTEKRRRCRPGFADGDRRSRGIVSE